MGCSRAWLRDDAWMNLPNYVEVETSRYCNRRCEWCPNHPLKNRTVQEFLPWAYFERVVDSLAGGRYRGWFAFHNYNEPLANPRLLKELRLVRSRLPDAKPTIYTNGDRLTSSLFDELISAGLLQMRLTIYPKKRRVSTPSHDSLRAWLERRPFLHKRTWKSINARQGPALIHKGPPELILISPNVDEYYDRGGTVPWLSLQSRAKPCLLTSNSLSIDFLGNVKMCCNVVTGHPPHEAYFLGNVACGDVVEIWNSSRFREIRKRHARADWSNTPICRTCRQVLQPTYHD